MENIDAILDRIKDLYSGGCDVSELDESIKDLNNLFVKKKESIYNEKAVEQFLSVDLQRDFESEIFKIKEISINVFGKYDSLKINSFIPKYLKKYDKDSLEFLRLSGIMFAIQGDKVNYYRSLLSYELLSSRSHTNNNATFSFSGNLFGVLELCNLCIKNGLPENEVKNLVDYYYAVDSKRDTLEKESISDNKTGDESESKKTVVSQDNKTAPRVKSDEKDFLSEQNDTKSVENTIFNNGVTSENFKEYMDLFSMDDNSHSIGKDESVKTDISIQQGDFSSALNGFLRDNPGVANHVKQEAVSKVKDNDIVGGDFSSALDDFLQDNPDIAARRNNSSSDSNVSNYQDGDIFDDNQHEIGKINWDGSLWSKEDGALNIVADRRTKKFFDKFDSSPESILSDAPSKFGDVFDSIKADRKRNNFEKKILKKIRRKTSSEEYISLRKRVIDKCIKLLKLEEEYGKGMGK